MKSCEICGKQIENKFRVCSVDCFFISEKDFQSRMRLEKMVDYRGDLEYMGLLDLVDLEA